MKMKWKQLSGTQRVLAALAAAGALAGAASLALASDHQDTAEVELNPKMDMTDVYVFPSPNDPTRVVLVMDTRAFLTPADLNDPLRASFDPDILYQFKIDNSSPTDAIEDKVLQVTFQGTGTNQTVQVRGPVDPPVLGSMINTVAAASPAVSGAINANLGSPSGIQVFAGAADDPFFLDLEAFFCILPDRKPVDPQNALSAPCALQPSQPGTPFYFRTPAVNYVAGYNVLAIVIELPKAMIEAQSGPGRIGIWGTLSR